MKQSDPLALVDAGTLARPGPVGRVVRMALGAFCFYVLWEMWLNAGTTTASPVSTFGNRLLLILAALYIINYVVNIGFSKSWGRRPLFASGCHDRVVWVLRHLLVLFDLEAAFQREG